MHTSLSAFPFVNGAAFSDQAAILADIIEKESEQEKHNALRTTLAELQPQQRALLEKVFVHKKKARDVAHEEKVSEAAISQRLKKIYKKIKKYLPEGVKF